jgi:4-amino-4-deoxy-L-arabinose transferase-like glycosyltransferase
MPKRLNLSLLIVLLFILFACLTSYFILRNDNYITGTDSPNHLLFSIEFFYRAQTILENSAISIWTKAIDMVQLLGTSLYGDIYWPNGLNATASIFYGLFGRSLLAAKMSLLPYLIILLLSTYLIGKQMYSGFVGLLAAFLLFMYPVIFTSSRQFQLDFPLTAMVALTMLLFLKSDNFKDTKYSFFSGLSLGWAMLVKGQSMIFLIWPLLFMLYKVLRAPFRVNLKEGTFRNIAIFAISAGIIASVWWGHQMKSSLYTLREHIFSAKKAAESDFQFSWSKRYSFSVIFYHFRRLFNSLSPLLFFAFLVSFPFFLKRKTKHKEIILSWLLIPFFLFSAVFVIKEHRFLMPLAPAMALITVWALTRIKNKMIQMTILAVLLVYVLTQFYLLTWRPWHDREVALWSFKIFGRLGSDVAYEAPPPHIENLKIDEIFSLIKNNVRFQDGALKIGSISCGARPGPLETSYFMRLKDKSFEVTDMTEMTGLFLSNLNSMDVILFQQPAENSLQWPGGKEFIDLLRSKHPDRINIVEQPYFSVQWKQLLRDLADAQTDFKLLGKIVKDDGNVYYVYGRITRKAQ